MLTILGYTDRLSVAPGDTITFMVTTTTPMDYRAELVRVIHGDANPAGPGFKAEHVASAIDGTYKGTPQRQDQGSYALVPGHPVLDGLSSFTFAAMIWPTMPKQADQTILSCGELTVAVDGHNGVTFTLGTHGLTVGRPLKERCWYMVAVGYDAASGRMFAEQRPLRTWPGVGDAGTAEGQISTDISWFNGNLYMAGRPVDDLVGDHFNGKIDSPIILDAALSAVELDGLFRRPLPESHAAHTVAAWDFGQEIENETVVDAGPHGLHGRTVNLPARAMKGWNWDASTHRWTDRPDQYGAIHFHDDDVADAGWEPAFSLTVPDSLISGTYAAHVWHGDAEDGTQEDYITFFVRPPRGAAGRRNRPDVAFLAPTACYLAYANDHCHLHAAASEMVIGRLTVLQPGDLYINDHPELGLSCYDTHSDGSGVCYSSCRRPILNMRPKYASWLGATGSGLWQFNADTHLMDWLEARGTDFDVITDEDLHNEGAGLLAPYRVVLSGTHPEYHSKAMSDAMMAWLDRGGRLMYMGGNGWYWRIAWNRDLPGVIEVRRAEDGTRTWAAEPGEYFHSFTGEFGGLWRRNGRSPNEVVGVGFTAQGFDICSYYRRTPESHDDDVAFIFDGVDDEIIGDFGLVGGGAAGLELDRVERTLGTPPNVKVLASSEGHSDLMLLVNEESLVNTPDMTGTQHRLIRADLAFFETPAGGAVFSTGSIAWCGSLSHNSYDNNVSRVTGNVLDRFIDPEKFGE